MTLLKRIFDNIFPKDYTQVFSEHVKLMDVCTIRYCKLDVAGLTHLEAIGEKREEVGQLLPPSPEASRARVNSHYTIKQGIIDTMQLVGPRGQKKSDI